jgi:hypothetical protein
VNGLAELVPTFGPAEARRLTNQVKRDAHALWLRLTELYEGGAWSALNYASWHEYCKAEFGFGRAHSYRLLDAGRIVAAIPQLENEAQARELAPVLREEDEEAVVDLWSELREEYGEQLTAEKVRTAVERKLKPKPAAVAQALEADQLQLAKRALSAAYGKAAGLIADWLEEHPSEDAEQVCRQVAPLGWQGLLMRIEREAKTRPSTTGSEGTLR